MRNSIVFVALLLVSCNGKTDGNMVDSADKSGRTSAVPPAGAAVPPVTLAGDEPSTSASAKQAVRVVKTYLSLIERRQYAAARALWDNDGAAFGGDDHAMGRAFDLYTRTSSRVGSATGITAKDGQQFIAVTATMRVTVKRTGQGLELAGPVLLRRSANLAGQSAEDRVWRIWGSDLRAR